MSKSVLLTWSIGQSIDRLIASAGSRDDGAAPEGARQGLGRWPRAAPLRLAESAGAEAVECTGTDFLGLGLLPIAPSDFREGCCNVDDLLPISEKAVAKRTAEAYTKCTDRRNMACGGRSVSV